LALSIVRDQWDESIVKNALAHELRKAGIPFVREKRARVYYDGIVMGEYSADLLVDSRVMVEVKAIRTISSGNEAQLVNYLTAVNINVGLLINFAGATLKEGLRRVVNDHVPSASPRLRVNRQL